MPDYVYALHNFVPEKPDEVPFKVGDRIEVIERDELYQDGWWQVSSHSLRSLDSENYPSGLVFACDNRLGIQTAEPTTGHRGEHTSYRSMGSEYHYSLPR